MLTQLDEEIVDLIIYDRLEPLYILKMMHDNGVDVSDMSFDLDSQYSYHERAEFCWGVLMKLFNGKNDIIAHNEAPINKDEFYYVVNILWRDPNIVRTLKAWGEEVFNKETNNPNIQHFFQIKSAIKDSFYYNDTTGSDVAVCLEKGKEGIYFSIECYDHYSLEFGIEFVSSCYTLLDICKEAIS